MKYIKKFNENSSEDTWETFIVGSYDVGQLLELLIFKYGRIFTDSISEFEEYEGDYNPDEIYDTIKYELEQLGKFDDFVNNYEAYGIEKDENDPFHWRHRKKQMDNLKNRWDI